MVDGETTPSGPVEPVPLDDGAVAFEAALDDSSIGGDEGRRKLLLVSLPGVVVALPAGALVEVLPARLYARVPGAPDAVAGLANRRGKILTVVDLGVALGGEAAAEDSDHRVVVVAFGGRELGLAVSDVLQITVEWWAGDAERVDDGGEEGGDPAEDWEQDNGGDEQLRVVELDSVFTPLFGGGGQDVGEPTRERS